MLAEHKILPKYAKQGARSPRLSIFMTAVVTQAYPSNADGLTKILEENISGSRAISGTKMQITIRLEAIATR